MKVFVGVALLVVVGSAVAQYSGPSYGHGGPSYGHGGPSYGGYEEYAEPHYAFAYEVHDSHTGDIKSHKEERKGEHTQGSYYLVEPDGSKRTVEYTVEGKSGFNAHVSREQSKHPSGGYKSGYSQGGYQGGYNQGGYSSGGYGGASSSSSFSTGGYASGGYSSGPAYKPSYQPAYKPSYQSSYEPAYKPTYNEPAYKPSYQPAYKPSYQPAYEPAYKPSYNEPSYKPSYGGHATSSVSIATHGAKIATQTYHAAPSKGY